MSKLLVILPAWILLGILVKIVLFSAFIISIVVTYKNNPEHQDEIDAYMRELFDRMEPIKQAYDESKVPKLVWLFVNNLLWPADILSIRDYIFYDYTSRMKEIMKGE